MFLDVRIVRLNRLPAALRGPIQGTVAMPHRENSPLIEKVHDAIVPEVDGNLMNLAGYPNRFGLPAFYELHVWAWEDNPKGNFSDWNTHVTCERQPEVR
jgi:hypothetical protein